MNISELQKAYALAVRAAENPEVPLKWRNVFRAIHYQIFRAVGREDQTALAAAADRLVEKAHAVLSR